MLALARYPRTSGVGAVVLIVLGGGSFWLHRLAAPACASDRALHAVYEKLHATPEYDSIFLNDVRTEFGGFFSDERTCSAQVAEVRGNTIAADLPWRAIRYRVESQSGSDQPVVTVELGGEVPLAPLRPSWWKRLLAYL